MNRPPDPVEGDFSRLVTAIQDYAIFVLEPDGRIRTWNRGASRIMGYSAQEAIGRNFSMFYPPDALEARKPERELEDALRDGHVEDEGWRIRKDGTRFWANTVISPLKDDDGKLVGFAKVTRDLSERREAEERLRQSEELFRLLVQSVKDYAIFMLDPEGRIISWNAGAERIKGYARADVIGKHFSIFYSAEDITSGKPERELEIARTRGMYEEEGWRVRKDGSRFMASVVITAVLDRSNRLRGFAKVTRDISERRRVEEIRQAMLEQREARLRAEDARRAAEASVRSEQEANRAKDEFMMTLSHELRTPLTSILGWSRILPTLDPADESFRTAVDSIVRSAQLQSQLLEDVLDTARIVSGKLRLNIAMADVRQIVQGAIDSVRAAIDAKSISLEVDVGRDVGFVMADATRLQQILWNLLTNAAKFTPRGGNIGISAKRDDRTLVLTVTDNGEGIAPHFLPHLFEAFRQAEEAATRSHGGLGLGLSIVRYLAEAHGGGVEAASAGLGHGATFTVAIPIRAAETKRDGTAQPAREPARLELSDLSGTRILLVDDDEDGRAMVQQILEMAGAKVLLASSAQSGLEIFGATPPDIVLTDIGMPHTDGKEFVRILRRLHPVTPPIIALTAFPRRLEEDDQLFDEYLSKPIEPEALVSAIARFTDRGPAENSRTSGT